MNLTIKRWGNSPALRLPASIMKAVGLAVDQPVDIRADGGRIIIEPIAKSYTLNELLAQCDANAPAPDLREWDNIKPQGNELW